MVTIKKTYTYSKKSSQIADQDLKVMSYPSLDFGLWIFFGGERGGIVGKLFACFFFLHGSCQSLEASVQTLTGLYLLCGSQTASWLPSQLGLIQDLMGGTGVTSVVMTKQLLPLVCCKGSWRPQLCCAVTIS